MMEVGKAVLDWMSVFSQNVVGHGSAWWPFLLITGLSLVGNVTVVRWEP
jgi:hypothetical protein